MANLDKAIPTVEANIGGKKRTLVFTLKAFSQIEKLTGKNAINGEVFNNINATDLIAVVWATLQKSEPDLTIDSVGEMLSFKDIQDITGAITKAFEQATPEPEKKIPEDAQG